MDYEAKLEQFYGHLELTGATAIDIGAHLGRHALPLARQIGIGGLLYAFEPIPEIRARLAQEIAAQGLSNIVLCPFALSSERRVSTFNFIPNLPEESGLKKRHVYNAVPSKFVEFQVGVFRLDDLIPATCKVRFIKMDVEGGELDVLEGAPEVLRTSRPIVAFECGASSFLGYHDRPGRIFNIFVQADYAVHSITGVHMASMDQFVQESHGQTFWDYIAVPSEQRQVAGYLSTI